MTEGSTPPSYVTIEQAAQMAKTIGLKGFGYRTILKLVQNGTIPSYRPTKVYLITMADLTRFVESCKVEPGQMQPHTAMPGQLELFG